MQKDIYREIDENKDPRFIDEILKSKEYDFTKEEKDMLISTARSMVKSSINKDIIKQYINDRRFKFDSPEKAELITSTQDKEFILQTMNDKKQDGLTRNLLEFLNNSSKLFERHKENFKKDISQTLELPPEMTIGIEIEAEGKASNIIIQNMKYGDWKAKDDGSLKNGAEIVSPILNATQKDVQDIYVICGMLKDLEQESTQRCGGHIHIGADYLTEKASYTNLLALWGNAEKVIYEISNPPKEAIREEAVLGGESKSYARPISKKIEQAIESGTLNMEREEELEEFISQIQAVQETRRSGINFMNTGSEEKNTIEFRLSNGTIDPKTWIENINLFGGIVRASEELTQIQKKPEEQHTEEEKRKIEIFKKLCNGNLSETEIMGSLLDLTVSENQRHIYEKRYEKNSKLYRRNKLIEKSMQNSTASTAIYPKDIGKKVFTGENSIAGIEMQDASNRLGLDRNRIQQREDFQATL